MGGVLIVYLYCKQVGRLRLGGDRRFVFQYDEAWLAGKNAVPLSTALPLKNEIYGDEAARPFFANLLPPI